MRVGIGLPAEDDASSVIAEINARSGASWRLAGLLVGGRQSGAWRLRSTDGAEAVLKLALTEDWAAQVLRAAHAVAVVRSAGYPTPAWLATGVTAAGTGYQIQELIVGRSVGRIGLAEAQTLITVLERQAGLDPDPDRCWSDFLEDGLSRGLAELRAGASAAAASGPKLVAACDRLMSSPGHLVLPRHDLVHGDFRPGNILFDRGEVVGVVDIEALGSGTRVFDYATLLDHPEIESAALELLIHTAAAVAGPSVLRACFARVALDLARFIATAGLPLSNVQRTRRVEALAQRAEQIDELTR